jgi:dolichol-phosphate mannosyltransferase
VNPPHPETTNAEAGSQAGTAEAALGCLTVLVPTRNERANIAPLLERLRHVSRDLPLTVLFVDDSTDGTHEEIKELSAHMGCAIEVLHRPEELRTGGLAGAVRVGLNATQTELVCVMDADLQHPPEILPALVRQARRSNADVVVATRHGDGGEVAAFPTRRRVLSRASEMFARGLFPRRLRAVSDPMSGFFLMRRMAVDVDALRPCGFKILLEILLSSSELSIGEVGFRFGERYAGESKAGLREGCRYVRHLIALRVSRWNPAGKRRHSLAASVPVLSSDAGAPTPVLLADANASR